MQRKRIEHAATLEERLAEQAKQLREQAAQLPPSIERDRLLRKARQGETAAQMTAWIGSPGLRPSE